ncbi:MAG: AI-2E family transporter [Elusimicrobiota bacterium]
MSSTRRESPFLTVFIVAGVALYGFYRVHHVLTPFLLAAAFAYTINPLATYFEARGLRRLPLIVLGYLMALALGMSLYTGFKSLAVAEAELLQARAPGYMKTLQSLASVQQDRFVQKLPLPPHIARHAVETALGGLFEMLQMLPSHLLALLPLLLHMMLVPFIGFFFLIDGPSGINSMIQACPSRFVEQALHLLSEIDTALGNYLRGIVIVAIAIALASFVGLVILDVDNAALIAVLSGVSSFVPYLGAVIGALVGGAMAFYQFGTLAAGLKVVALFVGIRVADEVLLQPVIAKHSVHLHPMVFLLALILAGEIFGFMGLLFAIPAACILKALISVSWSWYSSERGLVPRAAAGTAIPYT